MTEAKRTSEKGGFSARVRNWRWWLVVVFVALLIWRSLPLRPLPAHAGDGEFAENTLQGRLFPFAGPSIWDFRGYTVAMPGFDLGGPHRAEYRVARLPNIGPHCMLYLAVDDSHGQWFFQDRQQRALQGRLCLEVVDSSGEVICQADSPLGKWIWSHTGDGSNRHKLFLLESLTKFRPHSEQEYVVRVTNAGEPALAGFRGYCYLECGPRP